MLCRLEIKNIALIDEVSIDLGKGLNILTGETGAGKSIIIDSINMLLGERFSRELIRTGKDKALIEAVFQTNNYKMEDVYEKYGIDSETDGTLVISREFNISGRSICRANGRLITVTALKEIGSYLIDVHGQYDNQSLLKSETQIELLDLFGGEKIKNLKEEYTRLFNRRQELKNKIKEIAGDERERERKIGLLNYQIDEIKKAKLLKDEEEDLKTQRDIYINAGKIIETLALVYEILFAGLHTRNSSYDDLIECISKLRDISGYSVKYESLTKKLEDISYFMEDIKDEIRDERDGIEYSPHLLEQIEERLALIYNLKKKYGDNIKEILEYCKKSEKELDEIIKSEEYINMLQLELSETENNITSLGNSLSKERLKASVVLEDSICRELEALEIRNARFKIDLNTEKIDGDTGGLKFRSDGLDRVEFLISPNVGEPLKSLSKIASGGEMARIMLAIKAILANVDRIPTLIFDEIDIGISGKGSQRVGEKLALLARTHQVICVTHQAQIACLAENHYLIEKTTQKDTTKTKVTILTEVKALEEVARILGGDAITEKTINLAREMRENAKERLNN